MTSADVAPASAAVLRGDWGERGAWYAFAVEHHSCDAIVAVDGHEIVGTGVGTRHGAVGWVGTIYVVPERRGEGLGRELSRVVADGLEAAGCRTLVLTATPAGRPIYERIGFAVTDAYVVFEHTGGADDAVAPDAGIGRLSTADLPDGDV
jgi:GNAT superfamily N-acetyltransferase